MRRSPKGFTLVEVLIALALSAAIFTAALNLLLGVSTAWEKARIGDLEADGDYRLFAFLQKSLENSDQEEVKVENLPGERGEMWLTFPIRNSPLTVGISEEWRTERFALVRDSDGIRLFPVVGEQDDRPRDDDGLLLFPREVELVYWHWDEIREQWEEEESFESRGGQTPEVPEYLIFRFPDGVVRWIRLGGQEGDLRLW